MEQAIRDFLAHMEASVNNLLDDLDADKDIDEKYDLQITWCGKTLTLPMHADLYDPLEQILKGELEDITPVAPPLVSCQPCDGTGIVDEEKCDTCWGTGLVSEGEPGSEEGAQK